MTDHSVTDHSKDFAKMVSDAGLPTTEAQAQAKWNTEASGVDSPFNNRLDYSPFWRAISALVTKPVLWLVNEFILKELLPNTFLKTASDAMLDLFGWAVDCERKGERKAEGLLTFGRLLTAGEVEIPLGTVVQSTSINGKIYSLVTIAPASISDGQNSVQVAARAIEAGSGYNLAGGYFAVLKQPITGVDSVTNLDNWLITPGADKEKPDDYRLRIRNQFAAINQFHTDAVYRRIITSFANIGTRNVFFEHGAPRGPGTANAYILMNIGEPGEALIAQIQAHVMGEGNHGHGDDVLVMPMPATEHDLTVTVLAEPFADEDDIAQLLIDVDFAVRAAFRENQQYAVTTTEPFDIFSFSKLGSELHGLFPALRSVRFNQSDIASAMAVPRLGVLVVELDD